MIVKIESERKRFIKALQDQLDQSASLKDLNMGLCLHLCNQTEQKTCSLINLESNKVVLQF